MDMPSKPKKPAGPATIASGLSAWLGGVAFCAGFGINAPVWVAGPLTVLSLAFAGLSAQAARRGALTASRTSPGSR